MKRLIRHPWSLALGAQTLGAYLRFAIRTTRWTMHGAERLAPFVDGAPVVIAFWHERLPLMPALWQYAMRRRAIAGALPGRVHILVSRHQDGRLIGSMMAGFKMDVVHGSTGKAGQQRGGAAGLRSLLAVIEAGGQVAITPDGPRGPRRRAVPGVAQLSALAGVPVMPCAAQTTRHRILRTWDRMVLPLPFGRGVLVCGEPIAVPRGGWAESVTLIEAALTGVAEQADLLCKG